MNNIVKEFIEQTIDDIESERYKEAFLIWYLNYVPDKRKDYENLKELFTTFDKVGIDLYHASEPARQDIIAEKMYTYIEDILNYDSDRKSITLPDIIRDLNSDLYINLIDRNNIFKSVVAKLLLKRNDIKAAPFRIDRTSY